MENIPWFKEILKQIVESQTLIIPFFSVIWQIIKEWWWIPVPFLLWPIFKYHWLFWRNRVWEATKKSKNILLEIRIPGEILKPMRAMETVLVGFWQIYGPPNWFEQWWKGEYSLSFGLEIVSIEGIPHFLIRIPHKQRDVFESHIYAQYPDAEITEVQDYTKNVPQDLPNDRWQFFGTDYTTAGSGRDFFPLKTYRDFETEHEAKEEKRIDPISSLMEGLSRLGEGEQFWIQINVSPVTDAECGFVTEAKKKRDKLVKRKTPEKKGLIIKEAANILLHGVQEKKKEDEKMLPPEMMLTPGEREIVSGLERKISKHLFKTTMRYLYLARRDKFFGGRVKIPMSYFNEFGNSSMGMIIPWGDTITKVKQNWYDFFIFQKRRLYVKKRRMFSNYLNRMQAYWPMDVRKSYFYLNSEELASIYHFPSRITSPPSVIPRVEAKKREAPHDLPIED